MKVLKLYADWCGPCKALSMTLNKMDIRIPIEEVNIETQKDIAIKYGVRSIPTMVLVDGHDLSEVRKLTGNANESQIKEFLGEYA